MINDLISEGAIENAFPIIINGKFIDGKKIKSLNKCDKNCIRSDFTNIIEYSKCKHGLTHYIKKVNEHDIVITEVIGNRHFEKGKILYKNRSVSLSDALHWFTYVEKILKIYNKLVFKKSSEDFDKFHEFTKWSDQISFHSNKILMNYGNNIKDAYCKAPSNVISLHKTSVMLKDALDTTGIYFNPNAAKYGKKRSSDIYRMIHKIVMVLQHSEASGFNKKIKMKGCVDKRYDMYESFKIIPLSFIQNAIKYSSSNEILVRFEELTDTLIISVISTGNHIPSKDLERLFERGYRTSWAKNIHHDGKGLGLYVSKIVSKAHEFEIGARSKALSYEYEGFTQAENIFYIKIH